MTNLKKLIERRQGEFKREYCVDRGLKIRWIRSIFYDDTDQIEKILEHDTQSITEAHQAGYQKGVDDQKRRKYARGKAMYKKALEDVLAGLPLKLSNEVAHRYPDDYAFEIGHNTALQTVRAQIEGLLGKIE
jgi:hypothetical protein